MNVQKNQTIFLSVLSAAAGVHVCFYYFNLKNAHRTLEHDNRFIRNCGAKNGVNNVK